MNYISVIIPCLNEEKYIKECINSIVMQDYPSEKMEVFFIDGMSIDGTRRIIQEYCEKYPFIKIFDNPKKNVPAAMNIGIKASKGDFIIRMDAHSHYPRNYLSKLILYAEKLNSDNIGGIGITDVQNKNNKSLAIKEVLSNILGVGNSLFRIGTDNVKEVDTVVFGCFKRNVFERFGYYDERLFRNQDIELNKRIKNKGGKVFLVPEIYCTYFARETFKDLIYNNFQNGFWNVLTIYYTKAIHSLSLRHFIPLVFLLSLILPPLLSITHLQFIYIGILSLIVYLATIIGMSIYLSVEKKLNIYYLIISFILLHISYGSGSLIGLVKIPFIKK